MKDADILVLGVTYKADVGDVRESPSLRVMQALHRKGRDVSFHDFYVEEVRMGAGGPRVEDLDSALLRGRPGATADAPLGYDLEGSPRTPGSSWTPGTPRIDPPPERHPPVTAAAGSSPHARVSGGSGSGSR